MAKRFAITELEYQNFLLHFITKFFYYFLILNLEIVSETFTPLCSIEGSTAKRFAITELVYPVSFWWPYNTHTEALLSPAPLAFCFTIHVGTNSATRRLILSMFSFLGAAGRAIGWFYGYY